MISLCSTVWCGKGVIKPASRHLSRWWRMLLCLYCNVVTSRPAHTAAAFAIAYRPQSEPPCCLATLKKFIFSVFVGECIRMAICLFTLGGTVLYKLSNTLTSPSLHPAVLTQSQWLDPWSICTNSVCSGTKVKFCPKSVFWNPPTWGCCCFNTFWLAFINMSFNHTESLWSTSRSRVVSWRSCSHITSFSCSDSLSLWNT